MTLYQRSLNIMNLVLKIYNSRENQGETDEDLEEYRRLVADYQFVFDELQDLYLTPRTSHQCVNDGMLVKIAMQYKPRGLNST